jgi:Tfp pilus assembly protein PilX
VNRPINQSGIVLPVVLVVLVVVTTLVLTQVRRGTVDERLAANWSRQISGEAAAESTLRYCESELLLDPRQYDSAHGNVVVSRDNTAPDPVWRDNALWAQVGAIGLTLAADLRPPGATSAACLIEDATAELNTCTTTGKQCQQSYWRKYRINAQVIFPDATAFGNVVYRSQSEIRLNISHGS